MKKGLAEKKTSGRFFLFMFMHISYGRAAQLFFITLWLLIVPCVAQQLDFPGAGLDDPALLARRMPGLVEEVLALYKESNRERYLDNLFKLQVVAGKYADAGRSLASLDDLRGAVKSSPSNISNIRWEIYAKARQRQAADKISFDEAFRQSFRETLGRIDDKAAYQVLYSFGTSLSRLRSIFQAALDRQKGKTTIELSEVIDLLKKYFAVEAFQSFDALTAELSDEDNRRRYFIEKDVLVSTPNRARASYVGDRSRRRLLVPGRRQSLDFESGFLTSRQFRTGSRLVITLGIVKRADMQINYGTGRDVSDETIADAKRSLNIKRLSSSFIEIPVLNAASAHKVSVF